MRFARWRLLSRLRLERDRLQPVPERIHREVTSYDIEMPHLHQHVLFDDDEGDILGFSELEMCCHGCGRSAVIMFEVPPEALEEPLECLRATKLRFKNLHASCSFPAGAVECPDFRSITEHIDMRPEVREELAALKG